MTRKEFERKIIELAPNSAIFDLDRIIEWIINHKEEIPNKEEL